MELFCKREQQVVLQAFEKNFDTPENLLEPERPQSFCVCALLWQKSQESEESVCLFVLCLNSGNFITAAEWEWNLNVTCTESKFCLSAVERQPPGTNCQQELLRIVAKCSCCWDIHCTLVLQMFSILEHSNNEQQRLRFITWESCENQFASGSCGHAIEGSIWNEHKKPTGQVWMKRGHFQTMKVNHWHWLQQNDNLQGCWVYLFCSFLFAEESCQLTRSTNPSTQQHWRSGWGTFPLTSFTTWIPLLPCCVVWATTPQRIHQTTGSQMSW